MYTDHACNSHVIRGEGDGRGVKLILLSRNLNFMNKSSHCTLEIVIKSSKIIIQPCSACNFATCIIIR